MVCVIGKGDDEHGRMTNDKPTGNFLDDARWNYERLTADFTLRLIVDREQRLITCRVSLEALDDREKSRGEIDPMKLFKRYYGEVKAAVDRKVKAGQYEADGSILVVSGEIRRRGR